MIDRLRSVDRHQRNRLPWTEDATWLGRDAAGEQDFDQDFEHGFANADDTLRLIFTCCHPALSEDAQVALALNALCGLTAADIASAYLVKPSTMAQRLVRSKTKIQEAGIPFRVPPSELMGERLSAVLKIFYLVFNAGYTASEGKDLVRGDLCEEGIHLTRLLCEAMAEESEPQGLLALMLAQHSRSSARCAEDGGMILLADQDRSMWNTAMIDEASQVLVSALAMGRPGGYQLQAAIACLHTEAGRFEDTDWEQILLLYERLLVAEPNPVIALNRAVAVSMARGVEIGFRAVEEITRTGELTDYLYLHSTRADLLQKLGRKKEAEAAYRRAIALATNDQERAFLTARLMTFTSGPDARR